MSKYRYEVLDGKRVKLWGRVTDPIIDAMVTDAEDDPADVVSGTEAVFDVARLPQVSALVHVGHDLETKIVAELRREWAPVPDAEQRVPFWGTMREYQKQGATFLIQRRRGMLFDAPGLGKTIQSLAFAT